MFIATSTDATLLITQRFSLYDRIMQTEFTELLGVLQAQDQTSGWLQQIKLDVCRIATLVEDEHVYQAASTQNFAALAQHSSSQPKAFTRFAKQACKVYTAYTRIWKSFRSFQQAFKQETQDLKVTFERAGTVLATVLPGRSFSAICATLFLTPTSSLLHMHLRSITFLAWHNAMQVVALAVLASNNTTPEPR